MFNSSEEDMSVIDRAAAHRSVWLAVFLAFCGGSSAAAVGPEQCGRLEGGSGPFDYRYDRAQLPIVELHHFSPRVEALLGGVTGAIGADVDYTLARFPNHHRALLVLLRLSKRDKSRHIPHMTYQVECYFERALRFRPNDVVARMLYSRFLTQDGRRPEAVEQLTRAAADASDNPLSQYNVGLLYLEMKEYDRALEQAHRAISLGMDSTGLTDGLKAAGQWRDPPTSVSAPASAAASGR
jgi:hypothetical protein